MKKEMIAELLKELTGNECLVVTLIVEMCPAPEDQQKLDETKYEASRGGEDGRLEPILFVSQPCGSLGGSGDHITLGMTYVTLKEGFDAAHAREVFRAELVEWAYGEVGDRLDVVDVTHIEVLTKSITFSRLVSMIRGLASAVCDITIGSSTIPLRVDDASNDSATPLLRKLDGLMLLTPVFEERQGWFSTDCTQPPTTIFCMVFADDGDIVEPATT